MQKPISLNRRRRGSLMAELPIALYLLIFGFAIPAIGMAALGARVAMLFVVSRNACNTACKATGYTLGASAAAAAQARGVTTFPYISGTGTLQIIAYPVSGNGAVTVYPPGPITQQQIQTSTYTYYVRWTVLGTIYPLISDSGWLGGKVPGLTGPITMNVVCEDYVENPNGLDN